MRQQNYITINYIMTLKHFPQVDFPRKGQVIPGFGAFFVPNLSKLLKKQFIRQWFVASSSYDVSVI